EPVDAESERLDRLRMRGAERPGRVELAGAVGADLLLLHQAGQLLLQLGRLDPRRRQHVAELASDAFGVAPDRTDVGHVAAVGVALGVLLAALHPEQEEDDDQDRERDQPEQAEQRREAGARTDRAAGYARPAPSAERPAQRAFAATRGLLSLRLLEEVELEVGVATA